MFLIVNNATSGNDYVRALPSLYLKDVIRLVGCSYQRNTDCRNYYTILII